MLPINKKKSIFSVLFFVVTTSIFAVTDSITVSKFSNFKLSRIVLTGNGYFGINLHSKNSFYDSTNLTTTAMPVGLMPIVLWKITPNLFFEGELELMTEHGMVNAEIGYLNLSYNINELGTLQIGKFLSPFGIFSERYHPFWINYAPNEPLGFSHGEYSPAAEIGASLRGGGEHINYAFYISKSPDMKNGEQNINEAGKIDFDIHLEKNNNMGGGTRIGILPFKNASVELGLSYKIMKIKVGDEHDKNATLNHTHNTFFITEETLANMYAVDLTVQKVVPQLKGRIDIKGQINYSDAGTNYFTEKSPDGLSDIPYQFNNISKIGFIMCSFKPILLKHKYIKNSGIFIRSSAILSPTGSLWYEKTNEVSIGLNYSFSWRNVLKLAYQKIWSTNQNYTNNNLMLQWALAF